MTPGRTSSISPHRCAPPPHPNAAGAMSRTGDAAAQNKLDTFHSVDRHAPLSRFWFWKSDFCIAPKEVADVTEKTSGDFKNSHMTCEKDVCVHTSRQTREGNNEVENNESST